MSVGHIDSALGEFDLSVEKSASSVNSPLIAVAAHGRG
jgi:hypothetical protein